MISHTFSRTTARRHARRARQVAVAQRRAQRHLSLLREDSSLFSGDAASGRVVAVCSVTLLLLATLWASLARHVAHFLAHAEARAWE